MSLALLTVVVIVLCVWLQLLLGTEHLCQGQSVCVHVLCIGGSLVEIKTSWHSYVGKGVKSEFLINNAIVSKSCLPIPTLHGGGIN